MMSDRCAIMCTQNSASPYTAIGPLSTTDATTSESDHANERRRGQLSARRARSA